MSSLTRRSIQLFSEAETSALGAHLAGLAEGGDVILLDGTLGTGKTVLARGFIRALTTPTTDVPSPTFTLVQEYESPRAPLYHFDLYRLEDPDEIYELGIEDAFADGISLIEWPDRLGKGIMPAEWLRVTLETRADDPNARHLTLEGTEAWSHRLEEIVAHV